MKRYSITVLIAAILLGCLATGPGVFAKEPLALAAQRAMSRCGGNCVLLYVNDTPKQAYIVK